MPEIISNKNLKRGRIAADNATTGVSKGHKEGFNKVALSTTSSDESAPPPVPAASSNDPAAPVPRKT